MLNHGRIDNRIAIIHIYFRFRKGVEISCFRINHALIGGAIFSLLFVVVQLRRPEHNIFSSRVIVNNFRCPCIPCLRRRYFYHALLRPIDQITRFPHHDRSAACRLRAMPIAISIDFEIGSDQIELISFRRADNERISQSFLT
ncbi:hypothetical protein D3C77_363640 [compost metagenome]